MDFLPYFQSSAAKRSVHHFKDYPLADAESKKVVGALINSSIFYIWFIVYGNGRNVALRDIHTFPCDVKKLRTDCGDRIAKLFDELMRDYKKHSVTKTRRDGVKYQEFYPGRSKRIIDEIDKELARYYGFSEEETDFVINYDIKYRMGLGSEDAEA